MVVTIQRRHIFVLTKPRAPKLLIVRRFLPDVGAPPRKVPRRSLLPRLRTTLTPRSQPLKAVGAVATRKKPVVARLLQHYDTCSILRRTTTLRKNEKSDGNHTLLRRTFVQPY